MVVVATWNVENLFRPNTPGGPTSTDAYAAKVAALAAGIARMQPQVLAVQEVGDPAALDDVRAKLTGDWTTVLSEHPDERGIRVGVLTTLPVTGSKQIVQFPAHLRPIQVGDAAKDEETTMGRGAVQVTVTAPFGPLTVITTHLKSKLLSYPGGRFQPRDEDERARVGAYALYRRAAEAATVRSAATAVLKADAHAACIVLGDLNDTPEAATTQLLFGPDGSQFGTAGESVPDKGDRWRLWETAPKIPEEHRYSRINSGAHELIDHILISDVLRPRLQSVDTGVAFGMQLRSIGPDPMEEINKTASDHAPVFASFTDA
jgi:endonuclease/exonuclease/phosphatase family metal-dependent hydrolase